MAIGAHTHKLAKMAYQELSSLCHYNGRQVVEIYCHHPFTDANQGPIINFNVKQSDGHYIGYNQVGRCIDLFSPNYMSRYHSMMSQLKVGRNQCLKRAKQFNGVKPWPKVSSLVFRF